MAVENIDWSKLMGGATAPHAARTSYAAGRPLRLHTHRGFAEVFWIEQGRGFHHLGQARDELSPGRCFAMQERDVHGFSTVDRHGFTLVNVAVPLPIWKAWQKRMDPWPWNAPVTLGAEALERLASWLPELHREAHPWVMDAFLTDLARLAARPSPRRWAGLPEPVRQALAERAPGPGLPPGFDTRALAKAVGWTTDHLNREVRRTIGLTTTDWLNQLRLAAAEEALRLGQDNITDVAFGAGFTNLPHFYRLFRRAHGCSPRAWRMRCIV